jgi:hypothetical protein
MMKRPSSSIIVGSGVHVTSGPPDSSDDDDLIASSKKIIQSIYENISRTLSTEKQLQQALEVELLTTLRTNVEGSLDRLQTIENGNGDITQLITLFERLQFYYNSSCNVLLLDAELMRASTTTMLNHQMMRLQRFNEHSAKAMRWLQSQNSFVDNKNETDICCGYLLKNITLVTGLKIGCEKNLIKEKFNIFKLACPTRTNVEVEKGSFALVICYPEKNAGGSGSMFGGKPVKMKGFQYQSGTKAAKR